MVGSGTISASKRLACLRRRRCGAGYCSAYSSCASRRDLVALGDDVGGLDHRHVDRGLVLHEPRVVAACSSLLPSCTRLIDFHARRATRRSASPSSMMCCAAMRDRLQPRGCRSRFTVMPATVTGRPARSAACRAILPPVALLGSAQPMMTSSTSRRVDAGALRPRARSHGRRASAPWVVVEGAAIGLADRRAGGRNDDGVGHRRSPFWLF